MKKITLTLVFTLLFINLTNAQLLLNHGYQHGTLPSNINAADITSAFTSWKNTFTESCGDDRIRVKFDVSTQTVSEGIGYGMLIAAYAGDQNLLDGLWKYYTSFLNGNGVMNWKIDGCSSVIGNNGASDAELDAAMALIIAANRWGNNGTINYDNDASNLIATIKTHEIESGTNVLKPGDAWGGSNTTNISYYAPGYYRAYNTQTNDISWNEVANKNYEIINLNQSVTGAVYNLVSDWCKADGNFSTEVASWASNEGKKYGYDAARTPWRIAIDYLWYGNSDALSYSNKCIDFINAKNGLDNIYPGYNLDGTAYEQSYKDVTFTGAYAVAAMVSTDQNFVNDAYTKVVNMPTTAYFGATLRVMYLLTLSGNFYSPEQFSALAINDYTINENNVPFPNPIENTLHLSFTNTNDNLVKIYTINGKLVSSNTYNKNDVTIDTTVLKPGIYILTVNKEKYKIIKN